ncbi:hypothetical protein J1N35_041209 [Gossypium stocksii]|uniref:Uncharacterized protein n=1 Tax=Gossypium stocksii TaxID=47602 RepID=A0A9D3UFB1_9ROSI|nr:hypothetical protein J1N35_041209 [Gossypium stocksii]
MDLTLVPPLPKEPTPSTFHSVSLSSPLGPIPILSSSSGLHALTNVDMDFNVLNHFWTKWEEFQKKWKEWDNLLFPPEPKPTTHAPIEEASDKEEEDLEGTAISQLRTMFKFSFFLY